MYIWACGKTGLDVTFDFLDGICEHGRRASRIRGGIIYCIYLDDYGSEIDVESHASRSLPGPARHFKPNISGFATETISKKIFDDVNPNQKEANSNNRYFDIRSRKRDTDLISSPVFFTPSKPQRHIP